MQVCFDRDYGDFGLPISECTRLVVYKGKLYTAIIPTGEFFVSEGGPFKLAYQLPVGHQRPGWAGGCWESWEWSKDRCLYFGGFGYPQDPFSGVIVRFDGRDWWRIGLTPGLEEQRAKYKLHPYGEEVFSLTEYGPHLYAKTRDGLVFRTKDGLEWEKTTILDGTPEVDPIESHGATVFGEKLYLPRAGAGLFSFDGTSWRGPLALDGLKYPAHVITYRDRFYVSFWNVRDAHEFISQPRNRWVSEARRRGGFAYPNLVYSTVDGETWEIFAAFEEPVRRMEVIDGCLWLLASTRNEQAPGMELHNSLWRYDGRKLTRLMSFPGCITDIAQYKCHYYVSCAHIAEAQGSRCGSNLFIYSMTPAEIEELARMRPEPRSIRPWPCVQIVQKDTITEPIPCAGYARKTVYLTSDQHGTLDILIDPDGRGSYLPIASGLEVKRKIPFIYSTDLAASWLRLRFAPSLPASVDSCVVLEG